MAVMLGVEVVKNVLLRCSENRWMEFLSRKQLTMNENVAHKKIKSH